MSSSNMTLHVKVGCPFCKKAMLMANAANIKVNYKFYTSSAQLKTKEYLALNPKGVVPTLETQDGVIVESDAVARYFAGCKGYLNLLGGSLYEKAEVDMWCAAIPPVFSATIPLRHAIVGKPYNEENLGLVKEKFSEAMQVFEERLALRTYLVGNNVTKADTDLLSMLTFSRSTVVHDNQMKPFVNVTRWFNHMTSSTVYTRTFGRNFGPSQSNWKNVDNEAAKKFAETIAPTPAPTPAPESKGNQNQNKNQNQNQNKGGKGNQKGNQQPKSPKKKQEKKQEPAKPKELTAEEEAALEEKEKKVEVSPEEAAALKVAGEWLFNYKTEWVNSPNRSEAMDKMFNEIDITRFSAYYMKYDKLASECKDVIKTSNMLSFFLRGLDKLNRDCQGVLGIYGEPNDHDIKGAFLWKSDDIHPVMKEHQSFEYYFFTKLDLKKPEDQAKLKEFWLNITEDESKIEGQTARVVKIFK